MKRSPEIEERNALELLKIRALGAMTEGWPHRARVIIDMAAGTIKLDIDLKIEMKPKPKAPPEPAG